MRRRAAVFLVSTLLVSAPTHASAFTVSAPLVEAQQLIQLKQQVLEYVKVVEQITNQMTQIENQVRQIEHAYTTVQHGVTNLARLDLNNVTDLRNLYGQLQGKISQAEYVGYQVNQSWEQARNLYPNTIRVLSAEQQRILNLHMADVKRDAARVAIQTESIQRTQERYQQRWEQVLNAAHLAQGNLQIQQAQAQALGLMGSQLSDLRQQLATQARQQSLQAMEETSKTYLEQTAIAHTTGELTVAGYKSAGKLLPMPRTGRE